MATAQLLDVPYVSQFRSIPGLGCNVAWYACGPACASMVAAYLTGTAPPFDRAVLASGGRSIVGRGVQPWQVVQTIERLAPGAVAGCTSVGNAAASRSLLGYALSRRLPIIALVKPSWVVTGINHYVVVTGQDTARHRVTINDPLTYAPITLPEPVFTAAWQEVRRTRPFTYIWAR